jgi:exodeoxyribonuclease V alpha subunit
VSKIQDLLKNPIEKSMPESVKNTIALLMAIFNQFRVLSAGHNGEWGDHYINNYLTQWHLAELKLPLGQNTWFHGRPVMILQNNYELGLFNGDIGFCLQTSDDRSRLEVFFENKTQGIAVNLLNEEVIATAYAMTIHKSQGSEFDHVAVTFDNSHARLLSKELIYTAVTRAKKQVTIYSTKHALEKAVQTPTERHTGLELQFY